MNLEESRLVWRDSLKTYKKALCNARAAYYSSVIEKNKNNPRSLFSTAARLTESHSSVELSIPIDLSGNDFMNFFNEKILIMRGKINNILPSISTSLTSSGVAVIVYLRSFSQDLENTTAQRHRW